MSNTRKTEAKDWTRKAMLDVLASDDQAARLARLRKIGVFDEHNKLTERATNWGHDYISHTLVEDEPLSSGAKPHEGS